MNASEKVAVQSGGLCECENRCCNRFQLKDAKCKYYLYSATAHENHLKKPRLSAAKEVDSS